MKNRLKSLLKKPDADYVEIRIEDSLTTRITFTGPSLEDCSQNISFGGNVRALVKGGWGFTTFNNLDELEMKIKEAILHARNIGNRRDENLKLADVPVVDAMVPLDVKTDPAKISLTHKVEIIKSYNTMVLEFDKAITTSTVRFFDKKKKLTFANSDGTFISTESIDLGFSAAAYVKNAEGSFFSYTMAGTSDDFNVVLGKDENVKKTCGEAIEISKAKQAKGGVYTVILDPLLAGVFIHEAFGHLSEGDNVFEDPNLQKVMVFGREFGMKNLNVSDSGLNRGVRGHMLYDDEGVATEKTCLIREGKLVGRLHSRETAAKMGEHPTGNARALTFEYPPIPRMRTTVIEPGDAPFDEMLKGIKIGIYCINATGGETNGELFTFTPADAFMIRDGKIAERVRDVNLSGNVFETLKNIDMIGNDFAITDGPGGCGKSGQYGLATSEGSPHIRIQNVVVGGK